MSLLDANQVRVIEADVHKARITLSHLPQELIDHICCEVEELMSGGKSFEEAYPLVKEKTGIDVLQSVQENARYLIDKNYATMKNTMKIAGNISLALIAIGTVFKIWHAPGAAPMLLFGFISLCLIFFPAAIYLNYNYGKGTKKPLLHLSALAGGITFMAGVLFKVMHWPGASLLLLCGWSILLCLFLPILLFLKLREANSASEKRLYILGVASLVVFEAATMFKFFHWPGAGMLMVAGSVLLTGLFVPLYTRLKLKRGEMSYGQFIFVITLGMYAVVLTFLLSLNVSDDVLSRFTSEEINNTRIAHYFEKKKERIRRDNVKTDSLNYINEEKRKQISLQADKTVKLIEDLKLNLVEVTNDTGEESAKQLLRSPASIKRLDNSDVPTRLLVVNGSATTLRKELEKFRKLTSAVSDKVPVALINLEGNMNYKGEQETWEEKNFKNAPLASALAQLSEIEKNVRLIESDIINN